MSASPGPVVLPSAKGAASLVGSDAVFAHCMLRISDPVASREFYEKKLGMKYLTTLDFEDLRFSLLFFAYTDDDVPEPSLPRAERAAWLWSRRYPTIECSHNWDAGEALVNGNVKPDRGFGHTGFLVDSAADFVKELEETGVKVVRPAGPFLNVGKIAFVEDPDSYWCEIIEKSQKGGDARPVFAQTMLRVKDPAKSIAFFQNLGMTYALQLDFPEFEFSLYFLACTDAPLPADGASREEKADWLWKFKECTVELTHNWTDDGEKYTNGNESGRRGFGHIAVIVDDVASATQKMGDAGYEIVRPASPFKDAGVESFVGSPGENYWVKLIQRTA